MTRLGIGLALVGRIPCWLLVIRLRPNAAFTVSTLGAVLLLALYRLVVTHLAFPRLAATDKSDGLVVVARRPLGPASESTYRITLDAEMKNKTDPFVSVPGLKQVEGI